MVGILAGTMVLTWLYNNTGGGVLMTILWHGSYNAAVAGGETIFAVAVTAAVILDLVIIVRRPGGDVVASTEARSTLTLPRAG